jgi:CRISPR-associated protein Cmr1
LTCNEKGWIPESTTDAAFFRSLIPPTGVNPDFPLLAGASVLIGESGRDAKACWELLGQFWARFRKGHFTEKRPEYNSMNGGEWRDHATLKALRNSDTEIALAKPYLGLPIIYQRFSNAFDGTLESENSGRMASPIILKPVVFGDGNVHPMIAILNSPEPKSITVRKRIVTLKTPTDDPVLMELGVKRVLDAVRAAALGSQFREVKL